MKYKVLIVIVLILMLSIIIVMNQTSMVSLDFLGNKSAGEDKYKGEYFAVYLIEDSIGNPEDIKNLDAVKLQNNSIIRDEDILEYDLTKHSMTITKNCYKNLLETEDIFSKYFMVVAEGENIYMGMFRLRTFSYMPNTSVIYLDNLNGNKEMFIGDRVVLNIIAPYSSKDMRSDKRIKNAINALGK